MVVQIGFSTSSFLSQVSHRIGILAFGLNFTLWPLRKLHFVQLCSYLENPVNIRKTIIRGRGLSQPGGTDNNGGRQLKGGHFLVDLCIMGLDTVF